MRSNYFLAFPVSLSLLWIAAGPLSYAAPPPLPSNVSIRHTGPSYSVEPDVQAEATNLTLTQLARRGCIPSSLSGSWTCDGSIPPRQEMLDQMTRAKNVGRKVSAFYTLLGGREAIDKSKAWMLVHSKLIPCKPGAVMFDEIVDDRWMDAVVKAMTNAAGMSRVVPFQRYISQLMAEQSRGTVWLFTGSNIDFDQVRVDPDQAENTWMYWEFPALTQNPHVDKIIRTDPNDLTNPPSLTTIWRQGDPTQVPRGLQTTRAPARA